MRISLIAALSQNYVIGVGGKLPWHIADDLKHFKTITQGHPVIMGRKTYESIGRLLPKRENLIISRNLNYEVPPGGKVCSSLDSALTYCSSKVAEVFVIGGGEIYQQALARADALYLTWIHAEIEGNAFFPKWKESDFVEISREDRAASVQHPALSFVTLERKQN